MLKRIRRPGDRLPAALNGLWDLQRCSRAVVELTCGALGRRRRRRRRTWLLRLHLVGKQSSIGGASEARPHGAERDRAGDQK
jgi:hypothetical protein